MGFHRAQGDKWVMLQMGGQEVSVASIVQEATRLFDLKKHDTTVCLVKRCDDAWREQEHAVYCLT